MSFAEPAIADPRDDEVWWERHYGRLSWGTSAERLAAVQGFVLTHKQARDAGLEHRDLRRLVYRGEWQAPRRGVVSPIPAIAGDAFAAKRRRHALACAAAALVRPAGVISGSSAAVLHALPVLSIPDEPELTRTPSAASGRRSTIHQRAATLGAADVTSWFGARVTTVARDLVDIARHDRAAGLVAADGARRERLTTADEVAAVLARSRGWPGVCGAREVLALASPLAESALESIVRLALHDAGLPMPQLQVEIDDPERGRRYRVDMLWPQERLVLEADGRVKYTADELWREKVRQERLVRLGYRVERVMWADVLHFWPATLTRLHAALHLA
jgi:very-short-patch-repair endonuclease